MFSPFKGYEDKSQYFEVNNKLIELNLSGCSLESNSWVFLNYLTNETASPSPRYQLVKKSIEENNTLVLFKNTGEPDYIKNESFINNLPIIYKSEKFYIIGKECKKAMTFEDSYLEQTNKAITQINGEGIKIDPCFILFKNDFLEKTCNFINFKGFKQLE
jgi:hypothetical protein